MPTIARTAVRMKDELVVGLSPYHFPRVNRNCGNDVAISLLAVEATFIVSTVGVEVFARRIEDFIHDGGGGCLASSEADASGVR